MTKSIEQYPTVEDFQYIANKLLSGWPISNSKMVDFLHAMTGVVESELTEVIQEWVSDTQLRADYTTTDQVVRWLETKIIQLLIIDDTKILSLN